MKKPAFISYSSAFLALFIFCGCQTEKPAPKPNIVVILADDLGWSDISVYGGQYVQTPHIDSIGAGGITFTQGYATAPICGPSRAGLITGRYQQRFGYEFQIHEAGIDPHTVKPTPGGHVLSYQPDSYDAATRQGLPVTEITLAEHLKQNGYKTAIIGKWHLGYLPEFYPEARGFDHHFGFLGGSTYYITDSADSSVVSKALAYEKQFKWGSRKGDRAIRENSEPANVEEYLTDRLASEAVRFIDLNKEHPFFLYVPFNAPHTPIQAPKTYYDRLAHIQDDKKRTYYAMIAALDHAVGKITAKLKAAGLEDNTLVFFIGDNGGASYTGLTDNVPLKGGKITQFEGGIRVPYLVKWPAKLPANKVIDVPVSLLDIFTTSSAAAGLALPADRPYDGTNLIPYITGETQQLPHEQLFWRHGFQKAVRKEEWKLLVNEQNQQVQLYHLTTDNEEAHNLAPSNPGKVSELQQSLRTWEAGLTQPLWKSWRLGNVVIENGEFYNMPL